MPGGAVVSRSRSGIFGDQQSLCGFGAEAGRDQPCREIHRCVVGVVLPLPRARDAAEARDLGGDGRVGRGVVEVGPGHSVPAVGIRDAPDDPVGTLDASTTGIRFGPTADLLVEGGENRWCIHAVS